MSGNFLDIIHRKEQPKIMTEPGIKPEEYQTKHGIMLLWDDLSHADAKKQLVTWGIELNDNDSIATLLELLAKNLRKNG
jgi:hypothetical protein